MARELSKLEKELCSIGAKYLPKHSHAFILKEWDFYENSHKNGLGKITFCCKTCSISYSINLTQEEQERLFHVDTPNLDRERPYTL